MIAHAVCACREYLLNATFTGRTRVLGSAALSGGAAVLDGGVRVAWDAAVGVASLGGAVDSDAALLDALLWAQV